MPRLRRLALILLASVSLGGLPACGEDDVNDAGREAEKGAKEAGKEAEKAKEDVDGY
jgi:hypothetical protein